MREKLNSSACHGKLLWEMMIVKNAKTTLKELAQNTDVAVWDRVVSC